MEKHRERGQGGGGGQERGRGRAEKSTGDKVKENSIGSWTWHFQ